MIMPLLPSGVQFGTYVIIKHIAQGGMGSVYLARQQSLQRDVAIKILPPQFTQDSEFLLRFERESHVMARLQHPNIVQVFDAGLTNEYHYIVMEYLPGGTLANELAILRNNNKRMSVEKTILIIRQIVQALDYAHQQGIVHRDIKPSNILIAGDGRYVLSDFGIVADSDNTKITRTLQTLGTPEYMSPEQANGMGVDQRSDLYSLGVVLYEILNGSPPFSGNNPFSILNKHVNIAPPPLSKTRNDVPIWLQKIVQKILEKQPENRFQTATELLEAFRRGESKPLIHVVKTSNSFAFGALGLGIIGILAGGGLLLNNTIYNPNIPIIMSPPPPSTPTFIPTTTKDFSINKSIIASPPSPETPLVLQTLPSNIPTLNLVQPISSTQTQPSLTNSPTLNINNTATTTKTPTLAPTIIPSRILPAINPTITPQPPTLTPIPETFCSTGKAEITSPISGATVSGIVQLIGSANCNGFSYYKFEFIDHPQCGVCFIGKGASAIDKSVLLSWNTALTWDGKPIPNGTYKLRLTVVGERYAFDPLGSIWREQPIIVVNVRN